MTEPLPCPFCGHVGLSQSEGSTFRWLSTECNGCGAQCGEERINTMTMERGAAIEQAKEAAIKTWNTRFVEGEKASVAQQAEPVTSYTLNTTKTAAVAAEFYWSPIGNDTPRGVKILLLGRGGVASLGHYHHKPGESEFWTHWAPLPKRRPE